MGGRRSMCGVRQRWRLLEHREVPMCRLMTGVRCEYSTKRLDPGLSEGRCSKHTLRETTYGAVATLCSSVMRSDMILGSDTA